MPQPAKNNAIDLLPMLAQLALVISSQFIAAIVFLSLSTSRLWSYRKVWR